VTKKEENITKKIMENLEKELTLVRFFDKL
jgi:hypothetical protein